MRKISIGLLMLLLLTSIAGFSQDSSRTRTSAGRIRNYTDVITKDAISDKGLFTVHKVADKYYFEIPDSLLRRDLLWITRYAAIPSGFGGGFVNAVSSV